MDAPTLTASNTADWNALVSASDDAWFWHTTDWLSFVKILGAEYLVADVSFMLVLDGAIIAACPLMVEERGGYRRFSYFGEFIPSPAFRAGLSTTVRAAALNRYVAEVEALAEKHDVGYARVIVPALSPAALRLTTPSWSPLLRHGFLEASAATQIIALEDSEDVLWRAIRKGHRSDIKRAAACEVHVWDRDTISDEKFAEYRALHARDAGRVTRVPETFAMMHDWVRRGHAVLVEAAQGGRSVAFAVQILFRQAAYYASSCKEPDLAGLPAMHLLQWRTMVWLKLHGYTHYDIGAQYFGPRWDLVPSAKDLSIASFKRGFGGETRRVEIVERFFSAAVLERVGAERLKLLVAGTRERQESIAGVRNDD